MENIVVEDSLYNDVEVFKTSSNLVTSFLSKSSEMPAKYQQLCTPETIEETE